MLPWPPESLAEPLLCGSAAFAGSLLLVPAAGHLARILGWVAKPRADRWGGKPTPLLGGVAIFLSLLFSISWCLPISSDTWGIVIAAGVMLLAGLYDDRFGFRPHTKLVWQILGACLLMLAGFGFKIQPAGMANALVSVFWALAVMNAVNLMDNMDGLAGGVCLVAACLLSAILARSGHLDQSILAAALGGSLLGFLLFNFPPARIYMGDAGSLSLGTILAGLTFSSALVAGEKLGTVSALLAPALIMAIPLLDVTLVSVTRLLRGSPISQGGRDHTSHRLVQLGLSERSAVLTLYALAAVSGVGGLALSTRWTWQASMVLVPLLWVSLGLFFAYLAKFRMEPAKSPEKASPGSLFLGMAFKRRLLEVAMDLCLAFACLCFAYLLRFDFSLSAFYYKQLGQTLPWAMAITVFSFHFCGLYEGLWEYQGLRDLTRFAKAALLAATGSLFVAVLVYRFNGYPRSVFPIYALLLFLCVLLSRGSYRMFDLALRKPAPTSTPVLIYGIGGLSEIAFREIASGRHPYRVVGFVDASYGCRGVRLHGQPVYEGSKSLEEIARSVSFESVVLAEALPADQAAQLYADARSLSKPVIHFRLAFEAAAPLSPEELSAG